MIYFEGDYCIHIFFLIELSGQIGDFWNVIKFVPPWEALNISRYNKVGPYVVSMKPAMICCDSYFQYLCCSKKEKLKIATMAIRSIGRVPKFMQKKLLTKFLKNSFRKFAIPIKNVSSRMTSLKFLYTSLHGIVVFKMHGIVALV